MPSVGIILVVFGQTDDELTTILRQVNQLTYRERQTFLVCNEPGRDLGDLVQTGVEILHAGTNLGFAGAANLGMRSAVSCGSSHFLLLNTDVEILRPDLIEELLAAVDGHGDVGAVSPVIFGAVKGRVWYTGGRLGAWTWFSRYPGLGRAFRPPGRPTLAETDMFCGCCALLDARLIADTGGFDEDVFAYFDEAELSVRARRLGWRCMVWPVPLLLHQKSGRRLGAIEAYYLARNPFVLIAKLARRVRWPVALAAQAGVWAPWVILRAQGWHAKAAAVRGVRDGLRFLAGFSAGRSD